MVCTNSWFFLTSLKKSSLFWKCHTRKWLYTWAHCRQGHLGSTFLSRIIQGWFVSLMRNGLWLVVVDILGLQQMVYFQFYHNMQWNFYLDGQRKLTVQGETLLWKISQIFIQNMTILCFLLILSIVINIYKHIQMSLGWAISIYLFKFLAF